MRPLSSLVRNWQAKKTEAVAAHLALFRPEWVGDLTLVCASTHAIHLLAMIEGVIWEVVLTPSFHGIHVQVIQGDSPETQSRLSRDLALRLNH